jgi:hypothetical protein
LRTVVAGRPSVAAIGRVLSAFGGGAQRGADHLGRIDATADQHVRPARMRGGAAGSVDVDRAAAGVLGPPARQRHPLVAAGLASAAGEEWAPGRGGQQRLQSHLDGEHDQHQQSPDPRQARMSIRT